MGEIIVDAGCRRRSGWGFSLIELMIALAIIAVTAAYAVPAYQDYLTRSRVGEGMSLAAQARLAVTENISLGQPFDAAYQAPRSGRNVMSVTIDSSNGQIAIRYTAAVAPADRNLLVLVPSTLDAEGAARALASGVTSFGPVSWECFSREKVASRIGGPVPTSAATLPSAWAMADCRA